MKATPFQIYRLAAELVDAGAETYSCLAVVQAGAMLGAWQYKYYQHVPAVHTYAAIWAGSGFDQGIWGRLGANMNHDPALRVMCLLMTAELHRGRRDFLPWP